MINEIKIKFWMFMRDEAIKAKRFKMAEFCHKKEFYYVLQNHDYNKE